VLRILRKRYRGENWTTDRDPFDILIAIVVSQNSTDRITERVTEDLRREIGSGPRPIAGAPEDKLVALLRPAGLAGQKVPKIKAAAAVVLERYHGDLTRVLKLPSREARRELMTLPGVGPKTADVWLSLVGGRREAMPVDTHIRRLALRWRLSKDGDYQRISRRLRGLIPPPRRGRDHLVLIEFGREICQARRPRCGVCPVYDLCDAEVKLPRSL
jgi:endonuclease-3